MGLFLRETHFETYNKKWGSGEGREPVLLSGELQESVEAFAQQYVWPDIANEAEEFKEFLTETEQFPLDYEELMKVSDIIEELREQKRLKYGDKGKISVTMFDE